jgi:serine/threonine protein kinase
MTPTPAPARVREVLDLALERPAHDRPAFIAGVCGIDDRLRDEVTSLLGALDAGGDLLEPPALGTTPEATPLTGLCFGNYRVGERVGEGGMGVVYRAEDTCLGRTVAVKALPAALARDAHQRARFEHEARILASLNHPNIAAIHGVEETARGPVLVLEFVPGETLARRLDRGRLSPEEAIAIATSIARGLEAAHAAGVVHRDLKPSNIQLTPEGAVKILDFGVAKQAAPREGGERREGHTASGQVIGTAGYMSPEQARGKLVDRRTDLWALGCVLFEMLTGSRAFDGETSSDTVAAVLRAEPSGRGFPEALRPRPFVSCAGAWRRNRIGGSAMPVTWPLSSRPTPLNQRRVNGRTLGQRVR